MFSEKVAESIKSSSNLIKSEQGVGGIESEVLIGLESGSPPVIGYL